MFIDNVEGLSMDKELLDALSEINTELGNFPTPEAKWGLLVAKSNTLHAMAMYDTAKKNAVLVQEFKPNWNGVKIEDHVFDPSGPGRGLLCNACGHLRGVHTRFASE